MLSILSRCRIPPALRRGIRFRRENNCWEKRYAKSRAIRRLSIFASAGVIDLNRLLALVRNRNMKTPTRAEIPESDKWDLAHLFADVSKWQEDFKWAQRTYPRIK